MARKLVPYANVTQDSFQIPLPVFFLPVYFCFLEDLNSVKMTDFEVLLTGSSKNLPCVYHPASVAVKSYLN